MRAVRLGLAVVLVTALCVSAGCRLPGGKSAPTRYWVLDSIEGEPQPLEGGLAVGVGPVELPAYLSRNEVVTRSGPNQLVVSSLDLWGQPLDANFADVLGRNLELLVPGVGTVTFPWKGPNQPQVRVAVIVKRFEVADEKSARLEATWSVTGAGGRALGTGSWVGDEPVQGQDQAAQIAAMSRALAALSREIAKPVAAAR